MERPGGPRSPHVDGDVVRSASVLGGFIALGSVLIVLGLRWRQP